MDKLTLPLSLKILGWIATAYYGAGGNRDGSNFWEINIALRDFARPLETERSLQIDIG
jgi:hypothetical protein